MFWRSSGIRITLTIMALFVLASVLVIGAIFWRTDDILTRRNIASVLAETRTLSEVAAREGEPAMLAKLRERAAQPTDMLYGLSTADSRPAWLGGLTTWPRELLRDNKTAIFEYTAGKISQTQSGSPRLAIGATLRLPDGGRLLVARDVSEQRQLANSIRNWFLGGFGLLSLLAIAAGWAINRLLMSRITAMTETTTAIISGDLTKRVPLTESDDEFDALAGNLNAMLERIESLMLGLREVSDNIAHDLKTPLNRLRIRAEEALRDPRGDAACREGLETTLVEADELIRTFNALLRVARLEAGTLGDNLETFDIAALIKNLAEFYEPVAEEAQAALIVEVGQPFYLSADRQLISQAMTNLVENALKYGLPDSASNQQIVIGAKELPGGAELWVADNGTGVPATDRDRVLKRFARLDAARSKPGTGLGLSLVAAVVRQHGGTIELADNDPGLKVILRLPPERLATKPVAVERQPRDDRHSVSDPAAHTV